MEKMKNAWPYIKNYNFINRERIKFINDYG